MSFSGQVKEELSRHINTSRHCQIAEIAAVLSFAGKLEGAGEEKVLRVYTENLSLARKYFILMKKTFQVTCSIAVRQNIYLHKSRTFVISLCEPKAICRVLQAVKWRNEKNEDIRTRELVSGLLVQKSCCRRAFIRGAFLSAGSMSDPEKSYHFEIVCTGRIRPGS